MSYDLTDKRVYLSGPMTGIIDHNAPAFADAERRCRDAGAAMVFNPATAWGHSDRPSSWYMRNDLHRLTLTEGEWPLFDAIVMLDGWHVSEGSTLEYQVARASGIALVNLREVGRND